MRTLTRWQVVMWAGVAAGAFHGACMVPWMGWGMVVFLYALVRLAEAPTARWAFYGGLAAGVAIYGPQLAFFWTIFHGGAVALWVLLGAWVGLFVLLAWGLRRVKWLPVWAWAGLLPVVWTGLEYFRCELYYLKFAWLTPGMAVSGGPLGVYGMGFLMMAVAAWAYHRRVLVLERTFKLSWKDALLMALPTMFVAALLLSPPPGLAGPGLPSRKVVGVQLEHPTIVETLDALDKAVSDHPDVQLLVLSEYTLGDPPPEAITAWCRRHERYLIIGGMQPVAASGGGNDYYDTAFVIDPKGEIVFSQGKCVPIQFMRDGLPATRQRVWDSPWGKIGICICYDLSYTRVTDELVRQGAKLLVVPAMDAAEWGAYEHALHARIAPFRAAEYGVPIVRVASSGVSQIVLGDGGTLASAPYPGQGALVVAKVLGDRQPGAGRLPWDRHVAPVCVGITGLIAAGLLGGWVKGRMGRRKEAHRVLAKSH